MKYAYKSLHKEDSAFWKKENVAQRDSLVHQEGNRAVVLNIPGFSTLPGVSNPSTPEKSIRSPLAPSLLLPSMPLSMRGSSHTGADSMNRYFDKHGSPYGGYTSGALTERLGMMNAGVSASMTEYVKAIETVSKEQQKLLRHQAQEMAGCKARLEEQSLLIEDLNSKLLHNEDLTVTPVPPGAPRPSVPTGPMPPRELFKSPRTAATAATNAHSKAAQRAACATLAKDEPRVLSNRSADPRGSAESASAAAETLPEPSAQPGVMARKRRKFKMPVAPHQPVPSNVPRLPGTPGGEPLHRSVAVQVASMQWTRFFFSKIKQDGTTNDNPFFQHMDVSLNKELKTYPTEVALNHELPLDLAKKWHRVYYRDFDGRPGDDVRDDLPQVHMRCSKSVLAVDHGNVLESHNAAARIEIQDFCKIVACMSVRLEEDYPAMCALQSGLLWYLAGQLEQIGGAVEGKFRIREQQLLRDLDAQIKSLETQVMEQGKDKVLLGMTAMVSGWKGRSKEGLGIEASRLVDLEEANSALQRDLERSETKVQQLTDEGTTLNNRVAELAVENEAYRQRVVLLEEQVAKANHCIRTSKRVLLTALQQNDIPLPGSLCVEDAEAAGSSEGALPTKEQFYKLCAEASQSSDLAGFMLTRLGAEATTVQMRMDRMEHEQSGWRGERDELEAKAADLQRQYDRQRIAFRMRLKEKDAQMEEMRINFKKQMQATMAKAQEVLEKSTSEEKAKKAAGFMSMAFQNAKLKRKSSQQAHALTGQRLVAMNLNDQMDLLRRQLKDRDAQIAAMATNSTKKQAALNGQVKDMMHQLTSMVHERDVRGKVVDDEQARSKELEEAMQNMQSVMEGAETALSDNMDDVSHHKRRTAALLMKNCLLQIKSNSQSDAALAEADSARREAEDRASALLEQLNQLQAQMEETHEELQESKQQAKLLKEEAKANMDAIMANLDDFEDDDDPESSEARATVKGYLNSVSARIDVDDLGDDSNNHNHYAETESDIEARDEAERLKHLDTNKKRWIMAKNKSVKTKLAHVVVKMPMAVQNKVKMMNMSGGVFLNSIAVDASLIAAIESLPREQAARILLEADPAKAAQVLEASQSKTAAEVLQNMENPKDAARLLASMNNLTHASLLEALQKLKVPYADTLLKVMDPGSRSDVLAGIPPPDASNLLVQLEAPMAASTLAGMMPESAARITGLMDVDVCASMLNHMSNVAAAFVMERMAPESSKDTLLAMDLSTQASHIKKLKVEAAARIVGCMDASGAMDMLVQVPTRKAAQVIAKIGPSERDPLMRNLIKRTQNFDNLRSAVIPAITVEDAKTPESGEWLLDWEAQMNKVQHKNCSIASEVAWKMADTYMEQLGLTKRVRPKKEKGEGDNADDMDSADEDSYEEMLASAGVRATATKQSGYKTFVPPDGLSSDTARKLHEMMAVRDALTEDSVMTTSEVQETTIHDLKNTLKEVDRLQSGSKPVTEVESMLVDTLKKTTKRVETLQRQLAQAEELSRRDPALVPKSQKSTQCDLFQGSMLSPGAYPMSPGAAMEYPSSPAAMLSPQAMQSPGFRGRAIDMLTPEQVPLTPRPPAYANPNATPQPPEVGELDQSQAGAGPARRRSLMQEGHPKTDADALENKAPAVQSDAQPHEHAAKNRWRHAGRSAKNIKHVTTLNPEVLAGSKTLQALFTEKIVDEQVTNEDKLPEIAGQTLEFLTSKYGVQCTLVKVTRELVDESESINEEEDENEDDPNSSSREDGSPEPTIKTKEKHKILYTTEDGHDPDDEEAGQESAVGAKMIPVMVNGEVWGHVLVKGGPEPKEDQDEEGFQETLRKLELDTSCIAGGLSQAIEQVKAHTAAALNTIRKQSRNFLETCVNFFQTAAVSRADSTAEKTPQELEAHNKQRELDSTESKINHLIGSKRRLEQLLLSPTLTNMMMELRCYRLPSRPVVITICSLLYLLQDKKALRFIPADLRVPEHTNAIQFLWKGMQSKLTRTIIRQMQKFKHQTVAESVFKDSIYLMQEVSYDEVLEHSHAAAVLHEWIWHVMELKRANEEVANINQELTTLKNKL